MRILLSLFLLSLSVNVYSQRDFFDVIPLGDKKVGFCDSLIFCDQEKYDQYGYEGAYPLFLQIWHPLSDSVGGKKLTLKELRERSLSEELEGVYQPLIQKMDSASVWYNVSQDFVDYDSIDYGGYTHYEVLDTFMNYKTHSIYHPLEKNIGYPVIVYHHGSQGLSDENSAMAEYFASRGYIFISSNYHLPLENKTYGHSQGSGQESIRITKRVMNFAKDISQGEDIFYIGHSWGAQIGLSFLFEPDWAKAFVSMETTLEFWSKEDVSNKWTTLDDILKKHRKDYNLPILFLANTMEDKPFEIFEGINKGYGLHVSSKLEFGHESYTSAYLLRYMFEEQFPQPDVPEMKLQLELYAKHLLLIEKFLNSCKNASELKTESFKTDFFLNVENAPMN